MSDFIPDLVAYHEVSPDPQIPGCRNTRLEEDGVVFLGVEPLEGTDTFLGRTTLVEAVALLFNTTPEAVQKALTPKKKGRNG